MPPSKFSNQLLKFFRKTHLYVGIFISPALLFFALTGALQTFNLHEPRPNSSYKPPAWIAELAQVHKHQTLAAPKKDHEPEPAAKKPSSGSTELMAQPSPPQGKKAFDHGPMKIFFLLVTLGLFTSTITGLYMAYRYERNALLVNGLLIAGIIIPLVLLKF